MGDPTRRLVPDFPAGENASLQDFTIEQYLAHQ